MKRLINASASDNLPLDGSDSMTGNLNMDNNRITNLSTDAADILSAANVRHVNQAKAEMVATLTTSFNKKINESHISSSTDKNDVFRYIMEEVDESESESNIIVDGIKEFPASPHDANKKAYSFRMGKGAQNWYSSRLSFNMYKLPVGEYTLVIEFFPPSMDQVTLSVVSTSLNIGQQSTKLFSKYSRSIVHLHKWNVTPPERIYLDMRCLGVAGSPAQGVGHLIVYGIEGGQNDVSSDIYDVVYVVENGKMVLQTDLALNTHHLRGVSVDENDKTSAVSIAYLEDGGIRKAIDKIYPELFVSFIDFRLPDTYDLVEDGVYKLRVDGIQQLFDFNNYKGKKGIQIDKQATLVYPNLRPVDTQFVFVGVLKETTDFNFAISTDTSTYVGLKTVNSSVQLEHKNGQTVNVERHPLPDGFMNKRVISMAKFTRVGITYNIVKLEEDGADSFTFTPKSFVFNTISFNSSKTPLFR